MNSAITHFDLDNRSLFDGMSQQEIINLAQNYKFYSNDEDKSIIENSSIINNYIEKLRKTLISSINMINSMDIITSYKCNDPSVFYKIIDEFYNGTHEGPSMDANQDTLVRFMLSNLKGEVAYIEYNLPSDIYVLSITDKKFLVRIGNTIKCIRIPI